MVHVTGANGRYAVGDGEYGLTLMWRGVDTFFSVGQGEAALIESGMEFPATVEFMKNGFVRATLRLEDMPFSLYFRNTRVTLDKFKAYVVDSEMVAVDKALVIDRLCG